MTVTSSGEEGDRLARVAATLVSDDLDADVQQVCRHGGAVVAPSAATPNGRRVVVRHPDGAVFEYVGS